MITDNLYEEVLINPIQKEHSNQLYIVSGYASATFLRRHLDELSRKKIDFKINLIVGMPSKRSDHGAFLQLHQDYANSLEAYYYRGNVPVHSKVYSWYIDNEPFLGFAGSANYSQYGFFSNKQVNQVSGEDPTSIKGFYDFLLENSQSVNDYEVVTPIENLIPSVEGSVEAGGIKWIEQDKSVRISFLEVKGSLPTRSGLNWGQRKSKNTNPKTGKITYSQRNPDQAYLSIKKDATKEGFLPEKGFTFTMLTDDGTVMDCVVAQGGRKSIQTTNDNSELGRYIRKRLGVESGSFLTVENLEAYGRTDFTLIKIDDETFMFDFSV